MQQILGAGKSFVRFFYSKGLFSKSSILVRPCTITFPLVGMEMLLMKATVTRQSCISLTHNKNTVAAVATVRHHSWLHWL